MNGVAGQGGDREGAAGEQACTRRCRGSLVTSKGGCLRKLFCSAHANSKHRSTAYHTRRVTRSAARHMVVISCFSAGLSPISVPRTVSFFSCPLLSVSPRSQTNGDIVFSFADSLVRHLVEVQGGVGVTTGYRHPQQLCSIPLPAGLTLSSRHSRLPGRRKKKNPSPAQEGKRVMCRLKK